jgi:transposase
VKDYRLPQRQSDRHQMTLTMDTDGHHLLSAIDANEQVRDWLSQIPAVQVLRQVWIQQFYVDAEYQLHLREAAQGQPPAD